MVNVLDIIENNIAGMRLSLMADTKGETLPKTCVDLNSIAGDKKILPGSTCITPELDIAIMGNDGEWRWN